MVRSLKMCENWKREKNHGVSGIQFQEGSSQLQKRRKIIAPRQKNTDSDKEDL